MIADLNQLRRKVEATGGRNLEHLEEALSSAEEVVLIGSAAIGRMSKGSDIDILFVGDGKRFSHGGVDFIWVPKKKTEARSWLGSELATHSAKYGHWLRGNGLWREKTFFSETALSDKCERILIRLVKIYMLKKGMGNHEISRLLVRSLMDMQRAILLSDKIAVPPATPLLAHIRSNPNLLERVTSNDLTGKLGRYMTSDIFDFSLAMKLSMELLEERVKTECEV
jgi:hypothetical protein